MIEPDECQLTVENGTTSSEWMSSPRQSKPFSIDARRNVIWSSSLTFGLQNGRRGVDKVAKSDAHGVPAPV